MIDRRTAIHRRWAPLALVGLFGIGAMAAEDAVPTVPAEPDTAAEQATLADPDAAWTLDRCYTYAVANNSEIRKGQISIDSSTLDLLQARAAFDTGIGASYKHDLDTEEDTTGVSINQKLPGEWKLSAGATASSLLTGDNEGLNYNVSLSKALLGGNSIGYSLQGIHDARIDEAITRNDQAKLKRRLRRDVGKAYNAVIRELRTLSVQQRRVISAERNLQLAIERDRIIDITNAEIQVSESQDQVVAAQADIERSYDRLKRLIGVPVETTMNIVDDVTFAVAAVDPEADLLQAFSSHEDFLNLYLRIRKTDNAIDVGRERVLPDLSAKISLDQASEDDTFRFEEDVRSTVSLDFGYTFGMRSEKAAQEQRQLTRLRQDIELRDLHEDKREEVRDLERRLEQGLARIDLAERRLAMRERLVALYQDRYDNGEIDILELVRAQDQHQDAIVTLLTARLSYLDIVADYRFAIGR